jgi:hypothetical protein
VINNSYTKTIGWRPDNYSIISIMDVTYNDFHGQDEGFTFNLIKNDHGTITAVTQLITYDDLHKLSMILWEATSNYERRQREKKEAAAREAEAQGIGTDQAET